jgi:hypothetical protein
MAHQTNKIGFVASIKKNTARCCAVSLRGADVFNVGGLIAKKYTNATNFRTATPTKKLT